MTEERERLLATFREAGSRMLELARSLDEATLDQGPEGEWNPRQIIHHVADAEIVNVVRLQRLLTEDAPHLGVFDAVLLEARLHYERPVDTAIAVLQAVQGSNLSLIGSLDDQAWESATGTLEGHGPFDLVAWIERRIAHFDGHVAQILDG